MWFGKNLPKNRPEKVVMAFGAFDTWHAGNESYLKQAKELGDYLMVVVARDETIRVLTGKYPQQSERQRVALLKKSGLVNKVVLGNIHDKLQVILKYRPDVIALGYNQFVFTQRIEKTLIDAKINAEVIRLMPYFNNIQRSSLVKKQTLHEKTSAAVQTLHQ